MKGWAIALAAFVAGCRKEPPPPPAPPPAVDASSSFSALSGGLTRLECAGIAPIEEGGTCAASARPTDALVHASEKLADLFGMHHPPPAEWWVPMRTALDSAHDVDPKTMSIAERVTVQNAALHIAVAAKDDLALARDALALVDRLAFTAAERSAMVGKEIDLSSWLGPPGERIERTRRAGFVHEEAAHHTRVTRIVKTPRLRANFSELIAIDGDGAPFVTSVVGSIEIRAGRGFDAPACVALQSPERVRCNLFEGLREPATLADLPGGHFLRRDHHGHLRCNDCHGPEGDTGLIGAIDLAPNAVGPELASRRTKALAALRALLDPLRRSVRP